jgi:hypothetical protein
VLGARDPAAPRGEALGHRLLVEDAHLLPRQVARLQQRSRPHAPGAHRREPRQPGPDLPRRRATATRRRSASASSQRHAPWREHDLHRGEQRRPRAHLGQFSATADRGSKPNAAPSTPTASTACGPGSRGIRRAKPRRQGQLVPLIKGAPTTKGRRSST